LTNNKNIIFISMSASSFLENFLPMPTTSYVFIGATFSVMLVILPLMGVMTLDFNRVLKDPLLLPFRPYKSSGSKEFRVRWLLGPIMALGMITGGYYGTSEICRAWMWPLGIIFVVSHSQMTADRCKGNQVANVPTLGVCACFQIATIVLCWVALFAGDDIPPVVQIGALVVIGAIVTSWVTRLVSLRDAGWDLQEFTERFLCPAALLKPKKNA
jgi:hypothetical protein